MVELGKKGYAPAEVEVVDVLGVVHAVVRCDEPKQQIEPAQMNGTVSILSSFHVKLQLTTGASFIHPNISNSLNNNAAKKRQRQQATAHAAGVSVEQLLPSCQTYIWTVNLLLR